VEATAEALYEIQRERPKPGSKTGKREDKTNGQKLVWTDHRLGLKEVAVFYVAGGMDQVFREFLLASQLTRRWSACLDIVDVLAASHWMFPYSGHGVGLGFWVPT
jgi:hypothetical protein